MITYTGLDINHLINLLWIMIYMFIYIQGKFKSKCDVANKDTLYPYPWEHGDVYNMFSKQINWMKNITWLYFVSKLFTYSCKKILLTFLKQLRTCMLPLVLMLYFFV